MRDKKLPSNVDATKLLVHTAMGAVMGLALGVLLLACDPPFVTLLERQGGFTVWLFAGVLTTTFAIGATLTGVLFMDADA